MIFKVILSKALMAVMFVLSVSIAANAAEKSSWLFVGPYFSGDGTIYCKYVKREMSCFAKDIRIVLLLSGK